MKNSLLLDLRKTLDRKVPGVTVDVRPGTGGAWLQLLHVHPDHRRRGLGARALRLLCDWADENDLVLSLTPSEHFGADLARLIRWYSTVGFTVRGDQLMMRQPMAAAAHS